MAYGIVNYFKGGTKEQYDATAEAVHPGGGLPPGQLSRVAGETDGGFVVTVVWDSKETWETFRDTTLAKVFAELGDKGLPAPPEGRGFEVHDEKHA